MKKYMHTKVGGKPIKILLDDLNAIHELVRDKLVMTIENTELGYWLETPWAYNDDTPDADEVVGHIIDGIDFCGLIQ